MSASTLQFVFPQVPLDYKNPTGEKAAIAMIRVKAKISPRSEEYRGPILFNPGVFAHSIPLLLFR